MAPSKTFFRHTSLLLGMEEFFFLTKFVSSSLSLSADLILRHVIKKKAKKKRRECKKVCFTTTTTTTLHPTPGSFLRSERENNSLHFPQKGGGGGGRGEKKGQPSKKMVGRVVFFICGVEGLFRASTTKATNSLSFSRAVKRSFRLPFPSQHFVSSSPQTVPFSHISGPNGLFRWTVEERERERLTHYYLSYFKHNNLSYTL